MIYDLVVIGGGAGGIFAAIRLAEKNPGAKIVVLEAARRPLSKVEISGGGRCNVTHACFEPETLVQYYPRGSKELLGPFHRFQPGDIIQWLEDKGVKTKVEEDGRMFPVTDSSQTIIDCFLKTINKHRIELKTSCRAKDWAWSKEHGAWRVVAMDGNEWMSHFLLVSSGSDQRTWDKLKAIGHKIISPVPSLFTFQIKNKDLTSLLGISLADVILRIPQYQLEASGPLLITHWGLSGPAVLRLSAWGARVLFDCNYVFDLVVGWMGELSKEEVTVILKDHFSLQMKKQLGNARLDNFPSRLWEYLIKRAGLKTDAKIAELSQSDILGLGELLHGDTYRVSGKSTFKEEFVTAGGVDLKEVDFRKFESKLHPGLFLVGEVLDIDALTGGFNFQSAWTGAEIAATAMAERLDIIDVKQKT